MNPVPDTCIYTCICTYIHVDGSLLMVHLRGHLHVPTYALEQDMVFTSFQTDFVTTVHLHVYAYVIHVTCTVDLVNSSTDMSSSFPPNSSTNCPSSLLSPLPSPPWQPEKHTTGCHTQRSTPPHETRNGGLQEYIYMCTCAGRYPCEGNTTNAPIYMYIQFQPVLNIRR